MDLIDFSNDLGKLAKEKRKLNRAEQAKAEQAKKDLIKKQKQHEENKRQGML
jgi:hypothetical protein